MMKNYCLHKMFNLAIAIQLCMKTVESTLSVLQSMEKINFCYVLFSIHLAVSYLSMIINRTLKGPVFYFAYLNDDYSKTEKEQL